MARVSILLFSFTLICCKNNIETKTEEQTQIKDEVIHQEIQEGNAIYVTAKNGLVYRKEPNLHGERIGAFDWGTKLSVIEKTKIPFEVVDNKEIIKGEWLKVELKKHDWNGSIITQSGYVFGGYTVDSLNADFKNLPQAYMFSEAQQKEIELKELKLKFKSIDAKTFKNYPTFSNSEITSDDRKSFPEVEGGHFLIHTDSSIFKFVCGPNYSRPCNVYVGYLKTLNYHIIGAFGESIYSSFVLDGNDGTMFSLYTEQDGGGAIPIPSPDDKKIATYECVDSFDSEMYYDFRSIITIYEISHEKNKIKKNVSYQYANNEWEIWEFKWIDETSFALHVFDKSTVDRKKGERVPLNSKYLKASIVKN